MKYFNYSFSEALKEQSPEAAKEKFQKVQEAYENIKNQRGLA